jgi:hypothetical protein
LPGPPPRTAKNRSLVGLHCAVDGNGLLRAVRKENLEGHDLVAEQTERAGQLAVPSGLDMAADMHVVALAGWHKQAGLLQLGIELQQ